MNRIRIRDQLSSYWRLQWISVNNNDKRQKAALITYSWDAPRLLRDVVESVSIRFRPIQRLAVGDRWTSQCFILFPALSDANPSTP